MSNLIKGVYSQFVESRGIGEGHDIFQIFAETSEAEGGENGGEADVGYFGLTWGRKRERPVLRPKPFLSIAECSSDAVAVVLDLDPIYKLSLRMVKAGVRYKNLQV
jgi:hypothetical protein